MENQAETRQVSRSGLSFVIFSVIMGWLLDVLSTYVGMGIRVFVPGGYFFLFESSPYFMMFPAAWMLMLTLLAVAVYKFKSCPYWIRGWILLFCIALALFPGIRNTALILGVVFP